MKRWSITKMKIIWKKFDMKVIILTIIFLASFHKAVFSQEITVTMSVTEYENLKSTTDSLVSVISDSRIANDSLNIKLREQNKIIVNLNKRLTESDNLHNRNDSVIQALQDSISIQANEITRLTKNLASLDMVRLRYANGRLQLPYNKDKVNDAIELFNGITDTNLKTTYEEVLFWLSKYDIYINEVLSLLQSLQSDSNRENKFGFSDWRESALRSIRQNRYIKDRKGHYYTILYLDQIILLAENRLTRATKPSVDFSDLIDRLQL